MNEGSLESSLLRIEAALAELGRRELLQLLRSPVHPKLVRAALESSRLAPPDPIETLFAWKDGTTADAAERLDDIYIFPGYYALSIEDAISSYSSFLSDGRSTAGWLPCEWRG